MPRKPKTPEYGAWSNMIQRCTNPNATRYERYGGRGIMICDEWRNSFAAFLNHIGPRPTSQHSIDRYPNKDGNYEPGNVRWATPQQQQRNMGANHLLRVDGEQVCIVEASERTGVKVRTIHARLAAGMSPASVLSTEDHRTRRDEYGTRRE